MRKRKRQLDQRQQICLGLNLLIIFAELLGLYLRFYILGSRVLYSIEQHLDLSRVELHGL